MAKTPVRPTTKRSSSKIVDVVVLLRQPAGRLPPATESHATAVAALSEAGRRSGLSPVSTTIFDSLHSFSVRAPKAFVDALAKSQDVARVMQNAAGGSMFIPPVKSKEVDLPD